MKRLIFLFLDGVGIGKPDVLNPFYEAKTEFLPFYAGNQGLPDGTPVKPIDATLDVEGLPQSASGQTTLYTGENIPKLLNQHKDSYPTQTMRKIIAEKNILSQLKQRGLQAVFINAYPMHSHFFTADHISMQPTGELHFSEEFPIPYRRRISTTSVMMLAAQQTPFNEKDILAEKSIFQDYSNQWLIEKGIQLPEFTPEKAAEILTNASRDYDFMLYEYFLTDLSGHRGTFDNQIDMIRGLNRLVGKLLSLLNPKTDTLLLTSDHGNLEDSSTRGHTRNPVPLITWGYKSEYLRDNIHSLVHVTPAILEFFSGVSRN